MEDKKLFKNSKNNIENQVGQIAQRLGNILLKVELG